MNTTTRLFTLLGLALLAGCMFPKLPTCGDGKICPENDSGETGVVDTADTADTNTIDTDTADSGIDTFDTDETGDTEPVDNDGDGVMSDVDCDDGDANIYPNAPETCADTRDYNCDGLYGSADNDGDGFAACLECDDANSAVNPDATETCNDGVDDDCDGAADDADIEGVVNAATWYADVDSDGYGNPATSQNACAQPSGYADNEDDCDDGDALYHPGATETCTDAVDYNCDGSVGAVDNDSDGFAACEECDDGDSTINPDATETCNGVDDDCDGFADDDDPDGVTGTSTWYADSDSDASGDPSTTADACAMPTGYVADSKDCDDTDAAVNTLATETCATDYDDDCDGAADDAVDLTLWHRDSDSDGYGDPTVTSSACEAPAGYVSENTDCDDTSSAVSPSGTETCNDGVDDDCDGAADDADTEGATGKLTWYADADNDSFGDLSVTTTACEQYAGTVADATDCDDSDGSVNPDAVEVCNSDVDDNCDGLADDADASVTGTSTWYADSDSDGYGDSATSQDACAQPSGYVTDSNDCDDSDASLGSSSTWYRDADSDGYGDPAVTTTACEQPAGGYVIDATDCDDAAWDINPGYPFEGCNGVDDDCDGLLFNEDPDSVGSGYTGTCMVE